MELFSRWRKILGLTQNELAGELGISKQSYWNKEHGRTPFSDDEKVLIKSMLQETLPGVTIDDIFFTKTVLKSTEDCNGVH